MGIGGNGNGNGFTGMGGNGNRNSPSRTPLLSAQLTQATQRPKRKDWSAVSMLAFACVAWDGSNYRKLCTLFAAVNVVKSEW